VTASEQKKTYKNGGTASWTYLRCWKPDNPEKQMWVREEKVLEQVEEVLKKLACDEETLAYLNGYLREIEENERGFLRRQISEWQKQHAKLQNRLDTLMDLLLDGMIEREEFEAKKSKIREDQSDLEQQIANARSGDDAFKDAMLTILSIASEAYDLFKGSSVELKREMVNRVFANLKLDGGKLRYTLREPFDKMLNLTNRLEWQV
jgi:chromosome segregation ATPase